MGWLMFKSAGWLSLAFLLSLSAVGAAPEATPASLQIVWKGPQGDVILGDFQLGGLPAAMRHKSTEKDPSQGEVVAWEGILLAPLLEKALEKLTVDQRASIDLVTLVGKTARAAIPRSFISKGFLFLAVKRSGKEGLGDRGPILSVVPWTSKPKSLSEALPVQRYFVPALNQIILESSQVVYGGFFLAKRGDPRAVRGERIFVQACMCCHDSGSREKNFPLSLTLDQAHRGVPGFPNMSEQDTRAVQTYIKAFASEVAAKPRH